MIFLCRIVVQQGPDLHIEIRIAASFQFCDPLHGFFCRIIGVVNAGLVLGADVIALSVLHCWINHIEVGQQQSI